MADGRIFNVSNPTFMSSFLLAKKATNEEPIQIMWNTILTTWFPPIGPQAFKLAIKSPSLADNGQPDAIVIEVRLVGNTVRDSTQLREFQIFMVECKSWDYDTPSEWENAFDQLNHYLLANMNSSNKLFGAVAIGTKVVIYEWERTGLDTSSMQPIHAGTIDLQVHAHRLTLETALDRVKAQGWTLASTSI